MHEPRAVRILELKGDLGMFRALDWTENENENRIARVWEQNRRSMRVDCLGLTGASVEWRRRHRYCYGF